MRAYEVGNACTFICETVGPGANEGYLTQNWYSCLQRAVTVGYNSGSGGDEEGKRAHLSRAVGTRVCRGFYAFGLPSYEAAASV